MEFSIGIRQRYVHVYSILSVYKTMAGIGVNLDMISKIYLSWPITINIDRKIHEIRVWLEPGGYDKTKNIQIYSIQAVYITLTWIGVILTTISKIYLSSPIFDNIGRKYEKFVSGWCLVGLIRQNMSTYIRY